MYPSGSNDTTWMTTLLPPYPSSMAPGRYDYSSVVGFTPNYYGPHVPWTYYTPYLYGAGLGASADQTCFTGSMWRNGEFIFKAGMVGLATGLVGYWLGRRGRR